MTQEITQQAQTVINWFRHPLTKNYVEFLKIKNDIFTKQVSSLVEQSILQGNRKGSEKETVTFLELKVYRESLEDLLECHNIAFQEEDITAEQVKTLEDFFITLTKTETWKNQF